ncbi:hypothetical protein GCM10007383_30640 [Arenibacter certesii]|uniref:Uncharacterized protein n=1 Tax=Arenibacter certesii TaxID=228955 RepID=A0A918J3U3_9FLAO|nr:hypothetical protein GCM10007383_30640 [Arenibacter certesii]
MDFYAIPDTSLPRSYGSRKKYPLIDEGSDAPLFSDPLGTAHKRMGKNHALALPGRPTDRNGK